MIKNLLPYCLKPVKQVINGKTLFIILLLSGGMASAQEQQEEKPGFRKQHLQFQVGFNVSNFIKEFVSMNDVSLSVVSPYTFNVKALYGKLVGTSMLYGIRAGFGYIDNRNASIGVTSNTERTTDSRDFNMRLGLELQQPISKRWNLYYGVDWIYGNEKDETVSIASSGGGGTVRTVTTTTNKTGGVGPVLGIQFNINKHICLGTEATFYYTRAKGGNTTESSNTPGNISQTDTESRKMNIQPPAFINFNIIF